MVLSIVPVLLNEHVVLAVPAVLIELATHESLSCANTCVSHFLVSLCWYLSQQFAKHSLSNWLTKFTCAAEWQRP